ncbi:hypothetical protein CSKR_112397 [Clonorchis sinensis]|uniref:Uncharacterized protein n=2 Tax=Clonorchis sinensis TaxID=79923 RepID=A0A8T1M2X0_CLOSI|nr:hypothetical protein CSKR_112397 [Clonorchis sinensis]GAA29271.1 hypothetical protein CLF_103389 [Clonorchis sinensis]
MSKANKTRNPHLPRGSKYVDGQIVHTETNQRLYFRTPVHAVCRKQFDPSRTLSSSDLEDFVKAHYKERSVYGAITALEDRFLLEPNASSRKVMFHSGLKYHEIEAVYKSSFAPQFVVLNVRPECGLKYCELYKFKQASDAAEFTVVISTAIQNPSLMIRRGLGNPDTLEPSNLGLLRRMSHMEFQVNPDTLGIPKWHSHTDCPTSRIMLQEWSRIPQVSPQYQLKLQQQNVLSNHLDYSPSQRRELLNFSKRTPSRRVQLLFQLKNITFIGFKPQTREPFENLHGPVFMYSVTKEKMELPKKRRSSACLEFTPFSPEVDRF